MRCPRLAGGGQGEDFLLSERNRAAFDIFRPLSRWPVMDLITGPRKMDAACSGDIRPKTGGGG